MIFNSLLSKDGNMKIFMKMHCKWWKCETCLLLFCVLELSYNYLFLFFNYYQDEGIKVEFMAILMLGMKVMWLMELNHEDKEGEKCCVED